HAQKEQHSRRRLRPSGTCALTAPANEIDSPVRDRDAEGRTNRSTHKADFSAVSSRELGGNGEAEARSAGPCVSLKRLEQVSSRLLRHAGAGIGAFNDDH